MLYKQTSSGYWWFKIMWDGRIIRKSTKHKNKKEAQKAEAAFRTGLANGKFGIEEREPAPILQEFAPGLWLRWKRNVLISLLRSTSTATS